MVKKFLICIVFLFLISIVIAVEGMYEPTVSVQGEPNQLIIVRIKNADTGAPITSPIVELSSGGSGTFQFGTEEDEVQISILYIKNSSEFLKSDNIIKTIKRGIFSTHGAIQLNLKTMSFNEVTPPESEAPKTPEIEENQTVTTEENQTQEPQEEQQQEQEENQEQKRGVSSITGSSIFKDEDGSLSVITYLIFGFIFILLLAFILFFILKKRISRRKHWGSDETELLDAEEKLKAADKELAEIRERKKRLFEAEQKLKEDEKALTKLRKE